jgi:F0F1-type ATP synthase assembly protein I
MSEIKRFSLKEKKEKEGKLPWWRDGLFLFMNLSGYMLGPLALGYIVGSYIDTRLDSAPWGLVSASVLGFILSTIGILLETVKYLKKVEKKEEK